MYLLQIHVKNCGNFRPAGDILTFHPTLNTVVVLDMNCEVPKGL